MKISIKPTDVARLEADALILFCFENDFAEVSSLPKELVDSIKNAVTREDFKADIEQFLVISTRGEISAYKIILTGLGKKEEFDLYRLQESVARAVRKAKEARPAKVAVILPENWLKQFGITDAVLSVVCACSLSAYQFLKYKGEEERQKVRQIEEIIIRVSAGKIGTSEEGVRLGKIYSDAVYFARDLVNEPAELTTPSYLAKIALELAKTSKGKTKVTILEKDQAQKLGLNAFLGVAKGSDEPPKFIRLGYRPTRPKKKVVLIGKGITFDTGGLSIKSAEHMETMKLDMSGAAAVLSVFSALPTLAPPVEVVGLIAACENMPSGKALKPGDILKALNGKTIEVLNTDAEGRLTLADSLSYASLKEKPDEIIDLATLTGACMVALGEEVAGLWGNNEVLIKKLEEAGKQTAEKLWRMPLFTDYKKLIKSPIADVKNIQTGRYGGAITAALFLSEFVGSIAWVHLDIAGPAFAQNDTPLASRGGTGYGVRLLLSYLSETGA